MHGTVPPVRILRVITRLNIGGPSIQAIELTTRLQARGYQTLLAHGSIDRGEGDMRYLLDTPRARESQVVEVPHLRRPIAPADDLRAVVSLIGILRRFRPAIVHSHMAKAGTLARVAAVVHNRAIPRRERARLVHTYHGHVLDGYFGAAATRTFIGVERVLARATDRIVAISPRIRDELIDTHRIGRPAQYRVVPLGFDLDPFLAADAAARVRARVTLGIAPDADVVSTVGRLTAIKQQHLFLRVAELVAQRRPQALFVVAGDGELRHELETLARDLGIAARVRFLGWRRDLDAIYAATDVFLLTSRNEGTPVAVIESLAAGTPVVATDVGGVRDVIARDDIGLLAPFGDSASLADHVLTLLADPERRRRMGAAGRQSIAARYSLDRLVDDVDVLYRELLH